jgi:predicted ATPase/DNA-binding SARP family transcriptional activator
VLCVAVRTERARFSILGPLEIVRDGVPIAPAGQRQRRLLAMLILQPNRVVSTDQLVDAVWSTEPPVTARTALQVHISQLRKLVGADTIETHPGGYLLRVDPEQIDAARFELLLRKARAAAEPGRKAELLREALELVRGPALADLADESFAHAEAVRLDELCIAALEERIEADLASGLRAELIAELEAVVAAHPLRERSQALLMQALYQSGRQADALAVYREARRKLVEELGVEPGNELRELERAILTHAPSLGPSSDAAAAPPTLPAPATPLIGRERELEQAAAIVLAGQARLVTLTGPGGIGKTRFAVELARRLAAPFAGAVTFVSLAAIDDPLLVAPTIAQALDVNLTGGRSTTAALVERLRERANLLVVDNFEQVVSARLLLADLVAAAPPLTIVVTSRAVLHLSGEHEFPVEPLEEAAAAQLFVERARAAVHHFDPQQAELESVAEICARLDWLPLAIELAAARTQLLSPSALLKRLGSVDVLAGGARDLPQRHQTLRATIEWSLDLLSDEDRSLFARLSVFVGGWSLEEAEAVCGADGLLDGLATLVDNSLVQRSADIEPRFSMLETVRDYAVERLETSPARDELRQRHADVFIALAEEFERQYELPEQREVYLRLETEHGNIRAALAYLLESGEAEQALRLAAALRRFWQIHGHLAEGRRLLEAALANPGTAPGSRARAINGLGILVAQQGDFDEAARLFTQSLKLARGLDEPERVATALSNLGNVRLYQGRLDEARAAYVEAGEVWGAVGDRRGRVTAGQNLANLDLVEGRSEDAFRRFDETVVLAREQDDPLLLSGLLRDYARGLIEVGRVSEARIALAEAYPVMRDFGHLLDVAGALELYAVIAAAEGTPEFAAILFGAAARIRSSIGAMHRLDQTDVVERTLAAVRKRLDDQAFATAYERGKRIALERATGLPSGLVHGPETPLAPL